MSDQGITPAYIDDLLRLGTFLMPLITCVVVWFLRTDREAREMISKLDLRVKVIEQEMTHLPKKEDIHQIKLILSQLESKVEVLNERLEPVKRISNRLQEFMLEEAKKK